MNPKNPSRADTLAQRLLAGEKDFSDEDLDDCCHDLRGANLSAVNFARSFVVADFHGANLEGASFVNANVKTCDFSNANLRDADFSGAAIDGAVFLGAELSGAVFTGASEQGHLYALGELPGR